VIKKKITATFMGKNKGWRAVVERKTHDAKLLNDKQDKWRVLKIWWATFRLNSLLS